MLVVLVMHIGNFLWQAFSEHSIRIDHSGIYHTVVSCVLLCLAVRLTTVSLDIHLQLISLYLYKNLFNRIQQTSDKPT